MVSRFNTCIAVSAIAVLTLSVLAIICYCIDLYRRGHTKHLIGYLSSGGFMLLTIPIAMRLIYMHLTHWRAPRIQKYVVRIIWMVPIYSVESWLALRFRSASLYIETLRETYEAYVIYSFLYFLIALLGEEHHLLAILKTKPESRGHHRFPFNWVLSPWHSGAQILHGCKVGVLQYVVIKLLLAITVFVLEMFRVYDEGHFRYDRGYGYVCLVNNISQIWALYCLVMFYFALREELSPWRPIAKFACVKAVVFFTWWQSLAISIVLSLNIIHPSVTWTDNEIAQAIQDYLICLEMLVASIAFTFAFTHEDYIVTKAKDHDYNDEGDDEEASKPFMSAFLQSSFPDDMFVDIERYAKGQELLMLSKASDINLNSQDQQPLEAQESHQVDGSISPTDDDGSISPSAPHSTTGYHGASVQVGSSGHSGSSEAYTGKVYSGNTGGSNSKIGSGGAQQENGATVTPIS